MKAKETGICIMCNKPIEVGQEIGWARRGNDVGKKYHSACYADDSTFAKAIPALIAETVTESVPTVEYRTYPKAKSLPKLTASSEWYDILAYALQHLDRVILIGPPGTGKSTTAIKVCDIQHRITMTESSTREDLIGMFHLINGETKWVDGPIVQAMRLGVPVLIDEIDRYSQETASMLYSILDDSPHVALPSGEIVNAKQGYKVVMTSNELPDLMPAAIFDRIEGFFVADTPHKDAISELEDTNKTLVLNFYKTQAKVNIKTTPTVRRMRAYHKLKNSDVQKFASQIVFANSAREIESAMASIKSSEGKR